MRAEGRMVVAAGALLAGLALWWSSRTERAIGRAALEPELAELVESAPQAVGSEAAAAHEEPARSTAEVEALAAHAEITHRFTGRVLDERRRVVAGAEVELWIDGEPMLGGASASDGSFELAAALGGRAQPSGVRLRARGEFGRAGSRAARVPRAVPGERTEVAVEPIVLEPSYALRVSVRSESGAAVGAKVRVDCGHERALLERRECDERGELALRDLPPGPIHLSARLGERAGRALAFVPEEFEVTLTIEAVESVDVQVVDARTRAGVEGTLLSVGEQRRAPSSYRLDWGDIPSGGYSTRIPEALAPTLTGPGGRARIVGLEPDARYSLAVSAPGYVSQPDSRYGRELALRPEEGLVLVELEPIELRTVRWPIVAGELPPPPDGALELRARPGTRHDFDRAPLPGPARVEAGEVVVEAVERDAQLHALTTDGAIAQLGIDAGETLGAPVSFRRARRIEVLVRDAAGAPAPGVHAIARSQGNNALCAAVPTDENGRAELRDLYGALANVAVHDVQTGSAWISAGSVDLARGDGRVEVALPPAAPHALVRILVDGEPRLPSHYSFHSTIRGSSLLSGTLGGGARVVAEDPERGELRVALTGARPGERVNASLSARGHMSVGFEIELPADGSDGRVEVALHRSARLVAHVVLPASKRVELALQCFDVASGEWGRSAESSSIPLLRTPNGPRGSFVFGGIAPGRWRVFDTLSSSASIEVELAAGAAEVHVDLDLSSMDFVVCWVDVPDPQELQRVLVRLAGDETARPVDPYSAPMPGAPNGVRIGSDGTFRVPLPTDRDTMLVAWHPFYVPATEGGAAHARGGGEAVLLRMVEGDELRIPMPQIDSRTYERPPVLRIARYAGEPVGAPIEWHAAPILGGLARCAIPAGRWNLWIDPPDGWAPFTLRGVEVEGLTVLPAPTLDAGSYLTVNVLVDEGLAAPGISVHARRLGEPAYERSVESDGQAEVQLSGFGPGKFELTIREAMVFRSEPARELVLDGRNDASVDFDLRSKR